MNAPELVKVLRKRGYTVTLDGGRVVLTGPPPPDPKRAEEWMEKYQADIITILEAERILGAILK